MARTWVDRIVERPRTFTQQNNADGTITLIPAPGSIVQEGTPVNASMLNGIENDIQGLTTQLGGLTFSVVDEILTVTYDDGEV